MAEDFLENQRETWWIWSEVCYNRSFPVHNQAGNLVLSCQKSHSMWSAHAQKDDSVCGGLYARWDDSCIPDAEADAGRDMDEKAHSLWSVVLKSSSVGCACKGA